VGWVDDGSTASGLSPPPVPSTRAPPRAGAQRSGLTAPCAPPRAEAVRTGRHGQTLKTVSPELLLRSTFFRARHIFELTRTASGALHATRTGFHRGAVARISRVETRGGSIANVAGARRDKRGAAEATQGGGVSRNVCQISSWRTTSAWTARTSEPTGRSRESWCSKGSGYLPRPSTASPSSPLGWC
jgi:hypothetical protein